MGRKKKQVVQLVVDLKGKSVTLSLEEALAFWKSLGQAMSMLTMSVEPCAPLPEPPGPANLPAVETAPEGDKPEA